MTRQYCYLWQTRVTLDTKRRLVIGISGLFAVCAAIGWAWLRPSQFDDRVYRIGWMESPPFQVHGPDGKASGLSVDLVRRAARRRGIQLEWIYWNNTSESALVRKQVDLWPLITITPQRLKLFHI